VSEQTRALERAVAAWNEGDQPRYLALDAADAMLHSGSMGESRGVDDIRREYEMVWSRYDSRLELDDVFGDGDKVACRYRWIATKKLSGDAFTVPGVSIFHFAGGQCVER
jgi:hypothetical protein